MRTFTFLLFLVSLSFICSCDDETPQNIAPIDQLPPATQEGKYTFGCLVNGEAFVTESATDIVAIYQRGSLSLSGSVANVNMKMIINENGLDKEVYTFEPIATGNVVANYKDFRDESFLNHCFYEYEDLIEGEIEITHFDTNNFIISGLFHFSTVNDNCDTIHVTNGRFDTHYIP